MNNKYTRREALKNLALGSGALGLGGVLTSFSPVAFQEDETCKDFSKNINHSVCRWAFNELPLDEFAVQCKKLGITAIDLLRPEEWPVIEKHGLVCSMATDYFAVIEHGFNDPANHKELQKNYRGLIDKASKHGIKNVIVFSGNRRGMDDETGIENCATGLAPLLDYAAGKNVTLVMELLNSKVNHPDYQCDHTVWGVALSEKLNKANFKLLYDIYHMQIMEGDVIATIRKYHEHINHYHTAGVPGRNEIDDTQELYYPAIMRAIVETGFDGYVAQEFIPTKRDQIAALAEAVKICDV
ncbi:TIM barrel protein [Antarcticibacterium flavum]|uniref:TIM barrel protein n=1 Tax=Antarcticibacterium flavum TaxID=2058175 RepID=A0A5B7X274_9FLAO|nr:MULTISPECIES: TIM barrel protein [Antarcticibacterium]MCM4160196.1 hydroxypyruvate isomerase [Antarcticibacterium sp. W02-3]QCY68728.1 TIM barrel protein [Antarcticibacterium flavum]